MSSSTTEEDPPKTIEITEIWDTLHLNSDELEAVNSVNLLRYPDPEQIRFDERNHVICAKPIQLFFRFTDPTSSSVFQSTYLFSMKAFSNPHLILALLFSRFLVDITDPKNNIHSKKDLSATREKISRIITEWTSKSTIIGFDDQMKQALKIFYRYLRQNKSSVKGQLRKEFKDSVARMEQRPMSAMLIGAQLELPDGPPLQWTPLVIPPIEFARQFTINHSAIFRQISQEDLIQMMWNGKSNEHIDRLIDLADRLSGYVALTIIMPMEVNERGAIHSKWLQIALEFEKVNNYHGLYAVMYGLLNTAVQRMDKTVASSFRISKLKDQFERLKQLCTLPSSKYDHAIKNATSPAIPAISELRANLSYVNTEFPTEIDQMINWSKCNSASDILSQIARLQKEKYQFTPHERIQEIANSIPESPALPLLMKLSNQKETKRSNTLFFSRKNRPNLADLSKSDS